MTDIVVCQGGIGKNITFTSVISKFEKPIAIATAHPDVYKYNPNVCGVYPIPYWLDKDYNKFFFNHFENILNPDPYFSDFLRGEQHLIESFHDLCGFKTDKLENELFFSEKEEEDISHIIKAISPFVMVQFSGSDIAIMTDIEANGTRSLNNKQAQEIINILNFDLKYNVVNVFEKEDIFKNTCKIEFPLNHRIYSLMVRYCTSFIIIDSFLQHASADKFCEKKGVVLWGSSDLNMFGYKKNTNLKSSLPHRMVFNTNQIIDSFKGQL